MQMLKYEKKMCESMKYGANTEQWLQKNNKYS